MPSAESARVRLGHLLKRGESGRNPPQDRAIIGRTCFGKAITEQLRPASGGKEDRQNQCLVAGRGTFLEIKTHQRKAVNKTGEARNKKPQTVLNTSRESGGMEKGKKTLIGLKHNTTFQKQSTKRKKVL